MLWNLIVFLVVAMLMFFVAAACDGGATVLSAIDRRAPKAKTKKSLKPKERTNLGLIILPEASLNTSRSCSVLWLYICMINCIIFVFVYFLCFHFLNKKRLWAFLEAFFFSYIFFYCLKMYNDGASILLLQENVTETFPMTISIFSKPLNFNCSLLEIPPYSVTGLSSFLTRNSYDHIQLCFSFKK